MRPERVGAPLGDGAPELGRPVAFAAELGAPRPEPARHELQGVLVREADRAVHLMGDLGADARRLADPHLGDGDLERGIAAVGGPKRVGAAVSAAAVCPASTARFCWITWNEPMGLPN